MATASEVASTISSCSTAQQSARGESLRSQAVASEMVAVARGWHSSWMKVRDELDDLKLDVESLASTQPLQDTRSPLIDAMAEFKETLLALEARRKAAREKSQSRSPSKREPSVTDPQVLAALHAALQKESAVKAQTFEGRTRRRTEYFQISERTNKPEYFRICSPQLDQDISEMSPSQQKQEVVLNAELWEVIGGEESGGIRVHVGAPLSSREDTQRLSHGAFVKRLELEGQRLKFYRLTGTGPDIGWVSIREDGKPLVARRGSAKRQICEPRSDHFDWSGDRVAEAIQDLGDASGLQVKLFCCKHGDDFEEAVQEVPLDPNSLSPRDSFVLDAGSTLYVWHGGDADSSKRARADALAESLALQRPGVAQVTHEVGEEFWELLGAADSPLPRASDSPEPTASAPPAPPGPPAPGAAAGDERQEKEEEQEEPKVPVLEPSLAPSSSPEPSEGVKFYRVCTIAHEVVVQEVPCSQDVMSSSDCYVLDTGPVIYVSRGRGALPMERYRASALADSIKAQPHRRDRTVISFSVDEGFWRHLHKSMPDPGSVEPQQLVPGPAPVPVQETSARKSEAQQLSDDVSLVIEQLRGVVAAKQTLQAQADGSDTLPDRQLPCDPDKTANPQQDGITTAAGGFSERELPDPEPTEDAVPSQLQPRDTAADPMPDPESLCGGLAPDLEARTPSGRCVYRHWRPLLLVVMLLAAVVAALGLQPQSGGSDTGAGGKAVPVHRPPPAPSHAPAHAKPTPSPTPTPSPAPSSSPHPRPHPQPHPSPHPKPHPHPHPVPAPAPVPPPHTLQPSASPTPPQRHTSEPTPTPTPVPEHEHSLAPTPSPGALEAAALRREARCLSHEVQAAEHERRAAGESGRRMLQRGKEVQGKLPGLRDHFKVATGEELRAVSKLRRLQEELRTQERAIAAAAEKRWEEEEGPTLREFEQVHLQWVFALTAAALGGLGILGPLACVRLFLVVNGSVVAGLLLLLGVVALPPVQTSASISLPASLLFILAGKAPAACYCLWLLCGCVGVLRYLLGFECSLFEYVDEVYVNDAGSLVGLGKSDRKPQCVDQSAGLAKGRGNRRS